MTPIAYFLSYNMTEYIPGEYWKLHHCIGSSPTVNTKVVNEAGIGQGRSHYSTEYQILANNNQDYFDYQGRREPTTSTIHDQTALFLALLDNCKHYEPNDVGVLSTRHAHFGRKDRGHGQITFNL